MTYEWKEPPKPTTGGGRLVSAEIVKVLQSRPGEWLFVGRKNRSAWARSASSHPSRQIEYTSRHFKGQDADIYLRWVE